MPFDVAKDFAIISVPVTYAQVLVVNPAIKATTLKEFVDYAKSKKITYASGGNGSPSHLTMAAFLNTAGLEMVHIPYKGTGQSVIDVMGGQVDSLFAVGSGVLPQAKAGKLRALASSGSQRSAGDAGTAHGRRVRLPRLQRQLRLCAGGAGGNASRDRRAAGARSGAAMETQEVRDLNKMADYAPTKLNAPQSAAWLTDTRKHWADVITKAKITID